MMAMRAHLKMMTTFELREFKRQIVPDTTQILVTALKNKKTSANPLSRETSPHTNQTFTESLPSRETGPHPTKSMKKLAQALKKRAKYEAEQRTHTPKLNRSFEILAKTPKSSTQASRPDSLTKKLADTLKQYAEQKGQRPTCTYVE